MTALLSSLPRQEALFIGEGAALPARIRLRTLNEEELPRSKDVAFEAGWRTPFPLATELAMLANRMIGVDEPSNADNKSVGSARAKVPT